MIKKFISCLVLILFTFVSVVSSEAQSFLVSQVPGPVPIGLSDPCQPVVLSGVKIFSKEPFRFDFLMSEGYNSVILSKEKNLKDGESGFSQDRESSNKPQDDNQETLKLIKYFLASLTVPEGDLWVNLSPHEPDRIIPNALSQTQMGQDLLAQDYILKKLTASLMHPEGEAGKKFWDKIYSSVYRHPELDSGSSEFIANHKKISGFQIESGMTDMFNKIWIVPDQVEVYQNKDVAYITNAKLKVMLESDYVAESKDKSITHRSEFDSESSEYQDQEMKFSGSQIKSGMTESSKQLMREILIPIIEQEVNHGKHFAPLRQIFHSMILAKWYENHFKNSIIGQKYVDQNKVSNLSFQRRLESTGHNDRNDQNIGENDSQINQIYQSYLNLFNQGVTDLIREEYDPINQEIVTRKYFSGGFESKNMSIDSAQLKTKEVLSEFDSMANVSVDLNNKKNDLGQLSSKNFKGVDFNDTTDFIKPFSVISGITWVDNQVSVPEISKLVLPSKLTTMKNDIEFSDLWNEFINYIADEDVSNAVNNAIVLGRGSYFYLKMIGKQNLATDLDMVAYVDGQYLTAILHQWTNFLYTEKYDKLHLDMLFFPKNMLIDGSAPSFNPMQYSVYNGEKLAKILNNIGIEAIKDLWYQNYMHTFYELGQFMQTNSHQDKWAKRAFFLGVLNGESLNILENLFRGDISSMKLYRKYTKLSMDQIKTSMHKRFLLDKDFASMANVSVDLKAKVILSESVGGIDLNNLNIQSDEAMIDMNISPEMMQLDIPMLVPQIILISRFEDEAQLAEFLNLGLDGDSESGSPKSPDFDQLVRFDELVEL